MQHVTLATLALLVACASPDPKPRDRTHDTSGTPTTATTPSGTETMTIPPTVHQNLLVISIDTLRRDHLSRYDASGRNLMPFLDSLMDQGVVADAHHPGSNWTFHSMSTALSGRYPLEEGVLPRLAANDHGGWPLDTRFVAEELRDQGFATVMASANGWLSPQFGLSNGYDVYLGQAFDPADTTFTLGSDALQGIVDKGDSDRWYLHLHFLEPHAPFVPPVEYRLGEELLDPLPWDIDTQPAHYDAVGDYSGLTPGERALLKAHMQVRYEGELRWLDDRLAAFWADMAARGWLDDTLVVFWSDHGEQFWERSNQSHAFDMYPEETMGMFFLWSEQFPAEVQELRTSGADIAPTMFRHLGLDAPAGWTGLAISDIPSDRPVFADANARLGVAHSVTRNNRSLVFKWTGEVGFYHLDTDPEMQTDRFDASDPEVLELWELVRPRIHQAIPLAEQQTVLVPAGLPI